MPSPWTPRIPGAGWIARDRWRKEQEERLEDKIEIPLEEPAPAPRVGRRRRQLDLED